MNLASSFAAGLALETARFWTGFGKASGPGFRETAGLVGLAAGASAAGAGLSAAGGEGSG